MFRNDTLPFICVFIFVEDVERCLCVAVTQKTDIAVLSVTLTFLSVLLLRSGNLFIPDQVFFKGSEGPIICFQGLKESCRDNNSSSVWKMFPADGENYPGLLDVFGRSSGTWALYEALLGFSWRRVDRLFTLFRFSTVCSLKWF